MTPSPADTEERMIQLPELPQGFTPSGWSGQTVWDAAAMREYGAKCARLAVEAERERARRAEIICDRCFLRQDARPEVGTEPNF